MCKCSANTSNDVIIYLANNKQLYKELKVICNKDYIDDIIQDLYISLLEEPQEKLIRMCNEQQIKWFFIRCFLNQYASTSSPSYKYYKNNFEELVEPNEEPIDWNYEEFNRIVQLELHKLDFYERKIFELVAYDNKTFKELALQYNIKDYSIFYTFNKVRNKLKRKLKKYDL